MEHNFINTVIDEAIQCMIVQQKDNNLDGIDNLDQLPGKPTVFAVCGRVNGKPANARYAIRNLQNEIRSLLTSFSLRPLTLSASRNL
jgi:hypothetical protein